MLKRLLLHPLARGCDLDAPETTELHRRIIREKPFLLKIYEEWSRDLATRLPQVPGAVLELGSAGGTLCDHVPGLIRSNVFSIPGLDLVCRGEALPFVDGSLRAIAMTDVLHHIPDVEAFLDEAERCLATGGRILMVEPWRSWWAEFIYRRFHHEPFDPGMEDWCLECSGPLSGANMALPWIVFERDRERFSRRFPRLRIHNLRRWMPLRYAISGGLSFRCLAPSWSYPCWKALDDMLSRWTEIWPMFATITLEKT